MSYVVRMKIGFFKTSPYCLRVEKGRLLFLPMSSDRESEYSLHESMLNMVILHANRHACIEVHAQQNLLEATLADKSQLAELLHTLRQNIRTKLVCEFEGEELHESHNLS